MLSGMSEFPTYLFFFQFSFFENVADMLCDSYSSLTEQHCHLFLCKPYCLVLKQYVNFHITIFRLVKDYLIFYWYDMIFHNLIMLFH